MGAVSKEFIKSPIRLQVEAYEESWKQDYLNLKNCWDLEDALSIGLSTAEVLMRAEKAWRSRVFRGVEENEIAEKAQLFFELYQLWLKVTERLLESAAKVEQLYPKVEGAANLRQQENQVKDRVREWKVPKLSTAVGLREITLSEEGARELEMILGSSTGAREQIASPVSEISLEEHLKRRGRK